MNILGIFGAFDWDSHVPRDENGEYIGVHDSSACLVKDGEIVCSIAEERLTRFKTEGNYPEKSIDYCLNVGNIKSEEIDFIYVPHLPCKVFVDKWHDGTIESKLKKRFPNAKINFISHHLCHASSSIFTSEINEGEFFTVDGTGSRIEVIGNISNVEVSSIGYFNKKEKILRFFPLGFNIFGALHTNISREIYQQKVGKKINHIEQYNVSGKIMGMCAYGSDNLQINYEDYGFIQTSEGLPVCHLFPFEKKMFVLNNSEDNAKILQKVFEGYLVEYIKELKKKSYLSKNVFFAGGCFLNVLANTEIKKQLDFESIHIPPFTNDTGISIGAALYGAFVNGDDIKVSKNLVTLGKLYSDLEIEKVLNENSLNYKKYDNFEDLCEVISNKLNENKIVGWFQNKSESGPRALGSRSLLMHPGPTENKDIMNSRVKHREYWRPFAGIILEEYLNEYFEEDFMSPYMLYTFKSKEDKKNLMGAIIHADNTCRVQTVNEGLHYEITTLLKKFNSISGLPILMNTSFNDNGEPIVESPEDAVRSFLNMDIDYLAIGNFVVEK